jgi:hypothetical protein
VKRTSRSRRRRRWFVAAGLLIEPILLRLRGVHGGRNVIVRCHAGHLFTTIWIPNISFKAVRLGAWRIQRCPVGRHWTLVTPVRPSELTDEERRLASERLDSRVP